MTEYNEQDPDNDALEAVGGIQPSHTKAMLAHRRIKRIKDAMQKWLQGQTRFKNFQKEIDAIKQEQDEETLRIVDLMDGKERPMTERQKLDYIAKEAVRQYVEQMAYFEEHRIPLTLTESGDLYREPKEDRCYPMRGGTSKRSALLRILINYNGFCDSDDLQKHAGYNDYKTMADAIKEINLASRKKLDLPEGEENRLIISRAHSGYMINPLYPITLDG